MKIPVEWVDVEIGDWVKVRGRRVPQQILSFSSQVTVTQDNQLRGYPSVWLRTASGKVSWAWVSQIISKIEEG
jgi:hypothetical protein